MTVARAADGTELSYRVIGDGPRVLTCLHSLALDGAWYQPFAIAVCEISGGTYRCLIPDLRGHGRSGYGARPVTLRTLADDVRAVWDDAGVESSAVFGVSLGGMVAQAVAACWPERVEALVLAATAGDFDAAARAATAQRAQAARGPGGMAQLQRPTLERWFAGDEGAEEPLVQRARGQLAGTDGSVHADFLEAMTDVGSFHVDERVRTLVLGGTDDRSTPLPVIESLAAGLPGATLEALPGGHLFPFTHPVATVARVVHFLAEHAPEVLA